MTHSNFCVYLTQDEYIRKFSYKYYVKEINLTNITLTQFAENMFFL